MPETNADKPIVPTPDLAAERQPSGVFGANFHTHDGLNSPMLDRRASMLPDYSPKVGELYIDGTPSFSLHPGGTFVVISGATEGASAGDRVIDLDGTNGKITVVSPAAEGTYLVSFSATFGVNTADTVVFNVHKNGVLQSNIRAGHRADETGKYYVVGSTGILSLKAGDYVDVRIYSFADSITATVYKFNLSIVCVS